MEKKRPSKEAYYLAVAKEVAKRGTCLRRNFGVVIVNDDQIISTGYSGAPRGTKNCIDIGTCFREQEKVPKGQRYELCRSVHAEMNAIIHAARREMVNGTLYLVGLNCNGEGYVEDAEPCKLCKRAIINAGIKYVYILKGETRIEKIIVEHLIANEEREFYGSDKVY